MVCMRNLITLFIIFFIGCFLTYFINGTPDPGYENLWIVSIPIGGIIFLIPVFLYLFVRKLFK